VTPVAGLKVRVQDDAFVAIGGDSIVGMVVHASDVFTLLWSQPLFTTSWGQMPGWNTGQTEWVMERADGMALRLPEHMVLRLMVPA